MSPLLTVLIISVSLAFFAVVLCLESRRNVLSVLVGVSAGLVAAQIFQVHIFTLIVVVWAIVGRNKVGNLLRWQSLVGVFCAAPLAATVLFGPLVNSPTLALQLLAFAGSAAIIAAHVTEKDIRFMLHGILATVSIASLVGLIQVAGVIPNALWHYSISALGRPIGIYPEPDWLGLFSGIGIVLVWRLELKRWWRICLFTLNTSTCLLAFARAAWIAVGVSSLLVILITLLSASRRERGRKEMAREGRIAAPAAFAAVAIIALASIPKLQLNLTDRLFPSISDISTDISAQARVQQNDGLNYLANTAPWYGQGLSASGRVGVSGILYLDNSVNNLGSNWLLSLWVDGKFLALPIIGFLLYFAIRFARHLPGQLLGLVLINSFFSNALFQPITWLLLGLTLAITRIRNDAKSTYTLHEDPGESLNIRHIQTANRAIAANEVFVR